MKPTGKVDIWRAINPLRLIFWGGLLCIFDLSFSQAVNGRGFRFDFLNDALGALLIAVGVFQLSPLLVHQRYSANMRLVQVVSVLAVLDAVRLHIVTPWPAPIQMGANVLGLLILGAIVVFCICMRWLCEAASLTDAARSWAVTTTLFLVIYVLPLGVFHVLAAFAILLGRHYHIDLGPAGLLLVPLFAIPLVHLFVSTSRMRREALIGG